MKKLITIAILLVISVGCTENARTKVLGTTQTIQVPKGQKVFDVTWKGEDLWYATRPFREGEVPETCTFHAKTSYGMFEGTVIFTESD